MQHKSNKARAFKGKKGTTVGIDLMIANIPEGLPIPMVSSPPTSVPEWNFDDKNFQCQIPLSMTMGCFYSSTRTILS
jgi:hypothetical protein